MNGEAPPGPVGALHRLSADPGARSQVERLERTAAGWREGPAWSYGAVENDPRFVYADPTYGVAEGLVVSDREVFIVIDNNEQPRAAAPGDRRALLMRFERPGGLGSGVAGAAGR